LCWGESLENAGRVGRLHVAITPDFLHEFANKPGMFAVIKRPHGALPCPELLEDRLAHTNRPECVVLLRLEENRETTDR
jgi:hypothetical protein